MSHLDINGKAFYEGHKIFMGHLRCAAALGEGTVAGIKVAESS